MKKMLKILLIWFLIGILYYALEGIYRIPQGGNANVSMLAVGGLCGLAVGSINQIPRFYNMKILYQSLIGTIMTLVIEFVSGVVLNIWLQMGIWDYSHLPLNLLGQVCLPFALLWFAMMPFAIWVEDKIRYLLFHEGTDYSLRQIYKELVTLQ